MAQTIAAAVACGKDLDVMNQVMEKVCCTNRRL
jgi:hypothetical protein